MMGVMVNFIFGLSQEKIHLLRRKIRKRKVQMRKWHLEKKPLAQLKDHPRNPRYLSKENGKHLMQSMAKYGLIDKPIITHNGMIIGGHQRVRVLKDLGHEETECWVCDEELSDEEIDELC